MEQERLEFRQLADLRLFLHELRDLQIVSLAEYHDSVSGGFFHRHDKRPPGKLSKSSTATCVLSLVATGKWASDDAADKDKTPWNDSTAKLTNALLTTDWKTGGLPRNNLFTVAFILEAATELQSIAASLPTNKEAHAVTLIPLAKEKQESAQRILRRAASKGPSGLHLLGYPPSAYVAQLVVRTLKKCPDGFVDKKAVISTWAEEEINRQFALLTRRDRNADVFQLAYALILLANLIEPASVTPDQEFIIDTALDVLFENQRNDGTWPLSRPLFHYPHIGNAHCYDYEMLVQLLSEPKLSDKLLRFIPKLSVSAFALRSYFPLGQGSNAKGRGWSSGHHPQLSGPESWSTASVYHFAHVLERLLAEQMRIETFAYLGSSYSKPTPPAVYSETLNTGFLDCPVDTGKGTQASLIAVVGEKILRPLIADEKQGLIARGGKLSGSTPVSMIFFGPPGTSKTDLAKKIAKALGWPLLTIDASQFLKKGMDGVYAEADTIFGMLAVTERTLVLLDEFDEMVRARENAPDVLSRFLTTAMLPKLHKIHDNRRLVLIVATNHIDWFDVAIRRPGRFDVILQVMPPTAAAKLGNKAWPELQQLQVAGMDENELNTKLAALTYLETAILVTHLAGAQSDAERKRILNDRYKDCTLQNVVATSEEAAKTDKSDDSSDGANKRETWDSLCVKQSRLIRLP